MRLLPATTSSDGSRLSVGGSWRCGGEEADSTDPVLKLLRLCCQGVPNSAIFYGRDRQPRANDVARRGDGASVHELRRAESDSRLRAFRDARPLLHRLRARLDRRAWRPAARRLRAALTSSFSVRARARARARPASIRGTTSDRRSRIGDRAHSSRCRPPTRRSAPDTLPEPVPVPRPLSIHGTTSVAPHASRPGSCCAWQLAVRSGIDPIGGIVSPPAIRARARARARARTIRAPRRSQ
jgi:hypothetical protein